jgi:hypothetical protein
MWINWTHEAAFAKSRLTENSVGCVATQHNYIAVQCSSVTSSATVQLTARLVTAGLWPFFTPLSPARSAHRSSPAGAFSSGDYRIRRTESGLFRRLATSPTHLALDFRAAFALAREIIA